MKNRKDGKRVKNLDGMHGLITHIKPYRADSDVYINTKIDVTEMVKYVEKLNNKEFTKSLNYNYEYIIPHYLMYSTLGRADIILFKSSLDNIMMS